MPEDALMDTEGIVRCGACGSPDASYHTDIEDFACDQCYEEWRFQDLVRDMEDEVALFYYPDDEPGSEEKEDEINGERDV
jgi:hypothetical protein